jgi:hypothetical protein
MRTGPNLQGGSGLRGRPHSLHPTRITVRPGQGLLMKGHLVHAGAGGELGRTAVRLHLELQGSMGEKEIKPDTTYLLNPLWLPRSCLPASLRKSPVTSENYTHVDCEARIQFPKQF